MTQGQAAQSDSPLNDDTDDVRSFATSHRTLIRRQQSRLPRSSAAPLAFRPRNGSLSQPSHPELLRADEAGLSSIRLSGAEMQQRYHSAMAARGAGARSEMAAQDREADEVDVGVNTDVLRSRRRASISNRPTMTLASPFVITTTPLAAARTASAGARSVHTSTRAPTTPLSSTPSSHSSAVPPAPTVPRVRRNSTSALPSASEPLVELPPRRAESPYRNVVRERRPPASNPGDEANEAQAAAAVQHAKRRLVQEQQMDPWLAVRPLPLLSCSLSH